MPERAPVVYRVTLGETMITAFGLTDRGLQRSNNEDTLFFDEKMDLYLVADGMGGHRSGELASARAVSLISEFITQTSSEREITWPFGYSPQLSLNANRLLNALQLANTAIWRQADVEPFHQGMGTTVVCVLIEGTVATYASAGDSRLYLSRQAQFRQLTVDDSWVMAVQENDEMVKYFRHVLTKAVGVQQTLEISAHEMVLLPGDYLLVCTDGLHSVVSERDMEDIIVAGGQTLEQKVRRLIQKANDLGGPDNVTALLLHYEEARQAR